MTYLCIQIDVNSQLQASEVVTATNCTGYIAESAQAVIAQPTLQDIFNIPLASDMLQMWELGFGLPILCYLVAWGYGTVINMFSRDHDQ
ncbi:MAG: hypothetical protein EPN89_04590 [Methylovulum sp.]|nr:MAG: hypothetical protein EPN89_04590 [Methylovulum sp.]